MTGPVTTEPTQGPSADDTSTIEGERSAPNGRNGEETSFGEEGPGRPGVVGSGFEAYTSPATELESPTVGKTTSAADVRFFENLADVTTNGRMQDLGNGRNIKLSTGNRFGL